jgi:hypothetical protein
VEGFNYVVGFISIDFCIKNEKSAKLVVFDIT